MTLNGYFTLNSILRRYATENYDSESRMHEAGVLEAKLTGMYESGLLSSTAGLQRLHGNSSAGVAANVETESSTIATAQCDGLTRLLRTDSLRHYLLTNLTETNEFKYQFCNHYDKDLRSDANLCSCDRQGSGLGLDASVSRPSRGAVVPRLDLASELVRLGLVSVSSSEGLGLGLASA